MKPIPRDGLGVGLRPTHLGAIAQASDDVVDFFEVIVDNVVSTAELPRDNLRRVAARFPVCGHAVSLNVLGTDPLDTAHIARIANAVTTFGMPFLTDHLCFTATAGVQHHDLLPAPGRRSLVSWAGQRIRALQALLPVPFGIENASSYLRYDGDDLSEWAFLTAVLEEADCGLLLDVNNIVVSAHNHGFSPSAYLDAIPWTRVLAVHIAGHEVRPDGLRHDTHNRPVDDEVWDVYADAWRRGGPFPTVLEWDDDIPPFADVVHHLQRARAVRRST